MVRLGALGRAGILCNVMLYLEQTRFNRGGAPKPPEQARQAQQEIIHALHCARGWQRWGLWCGGA